MAADRLELKYVRDPNLDTPLTRSAEPVLRHLRDQLGGQSLSIVLTDPAGIILSRHTADAALQRHLDRVHLAAGFSYAEADAGTNGIGTGWRPGGRCRSSATSTTPRTSRTWPAPACRCATR